MDQLRAPPAPLLAHWCAVLVLPLASRRRAHPGVVVCQGALEQRGGRSARGVVLGLRPGLRHLVHVGHRPASPQSRQLEFPKDTEGEYAAAMEALEIKVADLSAPGPADPSGPAGPPSTPQVGCLVTPSGDAVTLRHSARLVAGARHCGAGVGMEGWNGSIRLDTA